MFTIDFYNNNAELNRVDKSNYLTYITSVQGELKESSSIIDPVITFELDDVPTFNYVKITEFNRYYFVNNIESVSNKLWRITLKCDVLMSYATQIKENYATIGRYANLSKIQNENAEVIDSKFPSVYKTEKVITEIANTPFNNQIGTESDVTPQNRTNNIVFRCMY